MRIKREILRKSQNTPMPQFPLPANLFEHLEKFGQPEHVYIIGGGVNGAEMYKHIPKDGFTMAVNSTLKACCKPAYYPYPWTIWGAFDTTGPWAKDNYWDYPAPEGTTVIMGKALARMYGRADYYFETGVSIKLGQNPITAGVLRGGGTITGCWIQLGWLLGASRFTLVGLDMAGKFHWNGTRTTTRSGVWGQCKKVQWLINKLQDRGARFNSLSATALKGIPLVKPGKER